MYWKYYGSVLTCRDNRRKRADKSPAYTRTPSGSNWECRRSSHWRDHTWPLTRQLADEETWKYREVCLTLALDQHKLVRHLVWDCTSTDGRRAAGYLGQVWPTLQHTWTSGRRARGWSTPVPPTNQNRHRKLGNRSAYNHGNLYSHFNNCWENTETHMGRMLWNNYNLRNSNHTARQTLSHRRC